MRRRTSTGRRGAAAALAGVLLGAAGCGVGVPDNSRVDESSTHDAKADPAMAAMEAAAKKAAAADKGDKGTKAAPAGKAK